MLVFALLAAGFGSSVPTEGKEPERVASAPEVAIEVEMAPQTGRKPEKHFFEPRFTSNPKARGYMVITPQPQDNRKLASRDGGKWLEPPGGWVSPDIKSRPFKVEPLERPKHKIRILPGSGGR